MSKRLITQADVIQAADAGQTSIPAPEGQVIITPGARDKAQSLGIAICDSPETASGEACALGGGDAPQAAAPASSLDESIIRQVSDILESRLPAGASRQDLERLVREAAAARLGGSSAPDESQGESLAASGVCLVKGDRLLRQEAGMAPVDGKVLLADAMQCGEGCKMAGGFMEWEKASFRRTVDHSEMSVVLDGELHLTVGGKTIIGRRGDMIFFPQGAKVIYSAPGKVRLACVNCIQ